MNTKSTKSAKSATRTLAALVAIAITAGGMSGCSVADDLIHSKKTSTYDKRADIDGDIPAWIPADATGIQEVAGTAGETASILLFSAAPLDPELCTEVPRLSAPTMEVEGAPDVYDKKVTTVFSCGVWSVLASPDGWYGWTPATEAATPTPVPAS